MRPLFQTRFPRFYRKRSGDRDVSARATHLKAAMENVFMTTTERKRMSTKTTFKRIALVAVAALGLGVLSVAPSSAAINATDETLTLSASSASVAIGPEVKNRGPGPPHETRYVTFRIGATSPQVRYFSE